MPDDNEPQERDPATTHADLYQRHGDPDPSKWEEKPAVTGRPNDIPLDGEQDYAVPNSTLSDRAKARKKWEAERGSKKIDEDQAQNKAVTSASTKTRRKRK